MKIFRPLIVPARHFDQETYSEADILARVAHATKHSSLNDSFIDTLGGDSVFRDEDGKNYRLCLTVALEEIDPAEVEDIADAEDREFLNRCKKCDSPLLEKMAHPTEHRLIGNCTCGE